MLHLLNSEKNFSGSKMFVIKYVGHYIKFNN